MPSGQPPDLTRHLEGGSSMRKLLILLAAAVLLTPSAVYAQSAGEIIGSAVIQVPNDLFECERGEDACGLRVRTYNELDPTDFFGAANPAATMVVVAELLDPAWKVEVEAVAVSPANS